MRNFDYLRIKIPSPEEIIANSYGEVTKPETINYRTQRPEKDGLFSERIFGPTKDYKCYCGKYKGVRYKGTICDKCGVEVTKSIVRRERMGHISLAAPVAHVWFLKTGNSKISLLFDENKSKIEQVVYYASYMVTDVFEENRVSSLEALELEYKTRSKELSDDELEKFKSKYVQIKDFLKNVKKGYVLSEADYLNYSMKFGEVFEAETGTEAIKKVLGNLNLKEELAKAEEQLEKTTSSKRGKTQSVSEKKLINKIRILNSFIKNNIRPEWMILSVIPVLPPDLRPMVALDGGRYASSDLNDLYRRVINRNNRLKKLLELKAPQIIVRNEKRMLQEAVDALIDNSTRSGRQQMSSRNRPLKSLADILKGKQGRFRKNLLGKRVDYSGRSVIVVGPELKLNECGLPKKMALEMFKPFVISQILERELAYNIKNANKLIEEGVPEVWEILEEVIKNKVVLLNRAPTLHRLGIQAFKPVLVEDLTVKIPPMVCAAFNADFDGDQMAVHLPLSSVAQQESKDRMMSSKNIIRPSNGDPIATPSQDIVLGVYYLTKMFDEDIKEDKEIKMFSSKEEALIALEFGFISISEPIKVNSIKEEITSVGRIIFNGILPEEFGYINETMNKSALKRLISRYINEFGMDTAWEFLDSIKRLGFEYASVSGTTWSIYDLKIPEEKKDIIEKSQKEIKEIEKQYDSGLLDSTEKKSKTIEIWDGAKNELAKDFPNTIEEKNPIHMMVASGARGSWGATMQMSGMKGLVVNPSGDTIELPVISSYKEGLSVLEYFISTHGARKGLTDTALKTAQAGYLTRRMADVAQDLIIKEEDCGTKESIVIDRDSGDSYGFNYAERIFGRTLAKDVIDGKDKIAKAGEIIDSDLSEKIAKSNVNEVFVRSTITCETKHGICSKCYGLDLGNLKPIKKGEAVGIIAAQSIGEPGTQLTLRTFHAGGVAGGKDITSGLPRIEEVLEARHPKGNAQLAKEEGVVSDVSDIEDDAKKITIKVSNKNKKAGSKSKQKVDEYVVPRGLSIYVNIGDSVEKGQQLHEGSIDPRELFKLKGQRETEKYILNEIQRIYVTNGNVINDKHIEVMVKKMFSRVKVVESGDSNLVRGQVVEKSTILEMNEKLKDKGKREIEFKQLILGISRVALTTDSFLSSSSFQETARVLVNASSEARVDKLRGLKENVIVGRLIPAGTGFENNSETDEEDE